jgi:UDP-N-acetylglucosamine:LPS N-acetylglucosamine transferase
LYYYCDLSLTRAGTTSLAEQKLYNMKLFMVPISRTHDQYDNAKRYVQYCDDIMIDQKDENFLNKLIMEFKRHKNFKKELQHTDREQQISITKEKIRDAILT